MQAILNAKTDDCTEGETGLKRHEIIDMLFGKLDECPDSGLDPFRAMLQSLLTWSHFDPYYFDKLRKLDRAVAVSNLEHLKQMQEICDARIKSDRERRVPTRQRASSYVGRPAC
jgi:hypothetical protein